MVATAGVLPRLSLAVVHPPLRLGTGISPSGDLISMASNLSVDAGGVFPRTGTKALTEGCRRQAVSNPKHFGVPAASTLKHGAADSSTRDSATKVRPVNYDVHRSYGIPVTHLPERGSQMKGDDKERFTDTDRTGRMINKIKTILRSMGDGEICISAYDTAWVALVPAIHRDGGGPQFPSSLKWIEGNQLPDGSWGDPEVFNAYDRLLNTLACVIALRTWQTSPSRCQRGISFLLGKMDSLLEENAEHMPIGFEVVFPSLLEIAKSLDLRVPYDASALREVYCKRELKLKRMPKDMVHEVPTTLLHSLEGMRGLDWTKLLRLQCSDGSFLFSPASTAYALMQTRDSKCLSYLDKVVTRFSGGVPNVYPVDLFERMWAVDRLERLGISRHFEPEIRRCLDYVYKHWTDHGIGWARDSTVQDVDDTAMGFRLLRLHGYDVSPDVFSQFEKDGGFFCFAGQSNQAISGIYNLNRASQVSFPGEEVLEEASLFSHRFLREKQARGELSDKWIITKDLPGEVAYALDFPWYASLPRVETRLYLDQYGGDCDVWIGKTLYRMPYVNNVDYLDLAISDFDRCQALHQHEWLELQRWYAECGLSSFGVSRSSLLKSYFLAAANMFEPERAHERLGWARTAVLAEAVSVLLRRRVGDDGDVVDIAKEMQRASSTFGDRIHSEAAAAANVAPPWSSSTVASSGDERRIRNGPIKQGRKRTAGVLLGVLLCTLDRLALDVAASPSPRRKVHACRATQQQIRRHLRRAWEEWMLTWRGEEEMSHATGWWPGGTTMNDQTSLLLLRTLELCAGRTALEESLRSCPPRCLRHKATQRQQHYVQLASVVSSLCRKLRRLRQQHLHAAEGGRRSMIDGDHGACRDGSAVFRRVIEPEMQELTARVLRQNAGTGQAGTQLLRSFLTVARSFYYVAVCPPATFDRHIDQVLFEKTT